LDSQTVYDIEFHGGSNGVINLLNRSNFLYYDPGLSTWAQYNNGLPFNLSDGEIKSIKLFYRDSKIRFALSRGIWEVDFPLSFTPLA